MIIKSPDNSQIPELKNLWKESFGDSEEFIDSFFTTAYSSNRCRCVTIDGEIASVLYWFDCLCDEKRIAYIYAVATLKAYRGRGLCHKLMDNVHKELNELGYSGVVLVPGEESLFRFYGNIGYETCCYIDEFSCPGKEKEKVDVRKIDKKTFASLRKKYLPKFSVIQENENLEFLETQAEFYSGNGFLLTAVSEDDTLIGIEFLGDKSLCESIIYSLGFRNGTFRTNGSTKPFAMFYPIKEDVSPPTYFGFAFD